MDKDNKKQRAFAYEMTLVKARLMGQLTNMRAAGEIYLAAQKAYRESMEKKITAIESTKVAIPKNHDNQFRGNLGYKNIHIQPVQPNIAPIWLSVNSVKIDNSPPRSIDASFPQLSYRQTELNVETIESIEVPSHNWLAPEIGVFHSGPEVYDHSFQHKMPTLTIGSSAFEHLEAIEVGIGSIRKMELVQYESSQVEPFIFEELEFGSMQNEPMPLIDFEMALRSLTLLDLKFSIAEKSDFLALIEQFEVDAKTLPDAQQLLEDAWLTLGIANDSVNDVIKSIKEVGV